MFAISVWQQPTTCFFWYLKTTTVMNFWMKTSNKKIAHLGPSFFSPSFPGRWLVPIDHQIHRICWRCQAPNIATLLMHQISRMMDDSFQASGFLFGKKFSGSKVTSFGGGLHHSTYKGERTPVTHLLILIIERVPNPCKRVSFLISVSISYFWAPFWKVNYQLLDHLF